MASIASRLSEFVLAHPPPVDLAFKTYLASVPVQPIHRLPSLNHLDRVPYWIAFPLVLDDQMSTRAFRDDILWAQYCVYLSERMRDDLLDGHTKDRRLAKIPDQLDRIAEETFARHFGDKHIFWRFYHASRNATSKSIKKVNVMQREILREPGNLLEGYAQSALIFNLGAIACCLRRCRTKAIPSVQRIARHLAIGSQIIDDVIDLADDLNGRRYNYAVQALLKKSKGKSKGSQPIQRQILFGLLHPGWIESVIDEALKHFNQARQLLNRHRFSSLTVIPRANDRAAHHLKRDIQQKRVDLLFGKLQAVSHKFDSRLEFS